MATTGTSTISFGTAPGTNVVVITVTGQTAITSGSLVEVWMMAEASANHNAYEHSIVPIKLTAGNIVNGASFDITAVTEWRLTGDFKIRWVYT